MNHERALGLLLAVSEAEGAGIRVAFVARFVIVCVVKSTKILACCCC